ncbi:MAG: hypothetical protein J4F39_14910 [Candidatus Latescibacteria bacterium]|nr:hypothetical protein [Candidatus Latescibacterota bacterium]
MANDQMTHDEIIQRMLKLDIDVMILRVVLFQVIRSVGKDRPDLIRQLLVTTDPIQASEKTFPIKVALRDLIPKVVPLPVFNEIFDDAFKEIHNNIVAIANMDR